MKNRDLDKSSENDGSCDGYSYTGSDLEILASTSAYLDWIAEGLWPYIYGDVLEIGAGLGAVSDRLEGKASYLDLVEPSPQLIGRLRAKFEETRP